MTLMTVVMKMKFMMHQVHFNHPQENAVMERPFI